MSSPTKQDIAHRLDAEWERLCRGAMRVEKPARCEAVGEAPETVRKRALDAWRCSLLGPASRSSPSRNMLLIAGAIVVALVLR